MLSSFGQTTGFQPYDQKIPGSDFVVKMQAIPAGGFTMGSVENEPGRHTDEGPQRKITLSGFWLAATETSRDAFDVFYKDEATPQNSDVDAVTRPSQQYIDFSLGMGKEGGFPVNSLSQYSALMFCRWLYQKTGIFYRLPSEAEWEYACRAGTTSTWFFGNDSAELGKYAWYGANSGNKFQKSGGKLPNAWGLYDMLGNVSEWTLDAYNEKTLAAMKPESADPAPVFSTARYPKVLKGGGYGDDAARLRVAGRLPSNTAWNRRDPQVPKSKWWLTDAPSIGFRILRPVQTPTKEEADAFYAKYLGQ